MGFFNMINNLKLVFKLLVTAIMFVAPVAAITYHGGGGFPYAIDPVTGRVYFAFSREAHGSDKGKWADFGGAADAKDKNHPTWIAARETAEESDYLWGSYWTLQDIFSKAAHNQIKNAFFINRPYAQFIFQVEYDKHINAKFQVALSKATKPHEREKNKVQWVSGIKLENALKTNNPHIVLSTGYKMEIRGSTFAALRNHALPIISQITQGKIGAGPILKAQFSAPVAPKIMPKKKKVTGGPKAVVKKVAKKKKPGVKIVAPAVPGKPGLKFVVVLKAKKFKKS